MNPPGVFKLPAQRMDHGTASGTAQAADQHQHTLPQDDGARAVTGAGVHAGGASGAHAGGAGGAHAEGAVGAHAAGAVGARTAGRPAARSAADQATRTAFVPLLLMALALFGWFGAQLYDAYQQRQTLLAAHGSQQQTVDNAGKLRQLLDALAADTQRLADTGNANAALLVTELRKRGITITVPGAAATAPETAVQPQR